MSLRYLDSNHNTAVDLTDVYNQLGMNQTIDSKCHCWFYILVLGRSVHTFGIASNLSNILQVTVPYPSPPAAVTGVELNDVGADLGGVLELSWNHSQDDFTNYEVYLETSQFSSISGLNPLMNISSSLNSNGSIEV